jgi:hypothetical protein
MLRVAYRTGSMLEEAVLRDLPGAAGGVVAIHPSVFHARMDTLPVQQWQIVQDPGRIRILVRPLHGHVEAQPLVDAVRDALYQQGASPMPVVVEEVATTPKASSGKTPLIRAHRP